MPARYFSANFITCSVPATASCLHSSRPIRNTTLRNVGAVALYRCTVARWAPTRDWTERSIRSSRAWVRTEIRTSAGILSASMSSRTKSKSVWLALGKPTSISL